MFTFKENDPLLQKETFSFTVDNLERIDNNIYEALLLPKMKSKYFPPFHTRSILVSNKLLEYKFAKSHYGNDYREEYFLNDISQGGYYSIPTSLLLNDDTYSKREEYDFVEKEIFKKYIKESPFKTINKFSNIITVDKAPGIISEKTNNTDRNPKLYCFYVGQGDCSLFIASNGNSYIIDTNIYFDRDLEEFTDEIKRILRINELAEDKIKGLIITHKHSDHIRGAAQLIRESNFNFDYFIINDGYDHNSQIVQDLYAAASTIPQWIDSNECWNFFEGTCQFHILNPNETTKNADDINDSSISFYIRDTINNNIFCLTGDTCYSILENCFNLSGINDKRNSVVKISHHGSRTGTSYKLIKIIKPEFAFVSAGYNKRYNHPHDETMDILNSSLITYDVSKKTINDILYESTSKGITRTLL